MFKSLLQFLLLFAVVVVIGYFLQMQIITYYNLNRDIDLIKVSYMFNGVFTIILTSGIILLSNRFKDQLGFIFLGASFAKIGIFMAIIKLIGMEINKSVFPDFFIPYVICLVAEVYYISKILNNIK
ncbi:DUF6168 family protein [Aquimarina sp. MMG016]|uniref:DUF6168 family protein n=1 Tax=Aquimarina sp. MMG016 TaxID=2822690 RepID=UPI001B3A63C6|nr:DUF6168 family protein [Aquimarina sp. MMG016]MBQ4820126.1 hypothetical protein [Aquimarina sp. MMG016]